MNSVLRLGFTAHNYSQQVCYTALVTVAGDVLAYIVYRFGSLTCTGRKTYGLEHISVVVIVADCCGMLAVDAEYFCKLEHGSALMYAFFEHFKG